MLPASSALKLKAAVTSWEAQKEQGAWVGHKTLNIHISIHAVDQAMPSSIQSFNQSSHPRPPPPIQPTHPPSILKPRITMQSTPSVHSIIFPSCVIQCTHQLQPHSPTPPSKSIQSIHSFNSGFVPPPAAVHTLVGRVQGKVEGEPLLFEETLKVRAQAGSSMPAACLPHDLVIRDLARCAVPENDIIYA